MSREPAPTRSEPVAAVAPDRADDVREAVRADTTPVERDPAMARDSRRDRPDRKRGERARPEAAASPARPASPAYQSEPAPDATNSAWNGPFPDFLNAVIGGQS
jgi:hypothetical protein